MFFEVSFESAEMEFVLVVFGVVEFVGDQDGDVVVQNHVDGVDFELEDLFFVSLDEEVKIVILVVGHQLVVQNEE